MKYLILSVHRTNNTYSIHEDYLTDNNNPVIKIFDLIKDDIECLNFLENQYWGLYELNGHTLTKVSYDKTLNYINEAKKLLLLL